MTKSYKNYLLLALSLQLLSSLAYGQLRTCTENEEWCPSSIKAIFNPVCGVKTENSVTVTETFFNVCVLCEDSSFTQYLPQVCEDDRELCDDGKLRCTKNRPICAALGRPGVFSTVSSIAEACEDPAVTYFTKGACGAMEEDRNYCLPNNRPESCPSEYDPVCGFTRSGGYLSYEILPSACDACSDPSIEYYLPGACVFKCIRDDRLVVDCFGSVDPICGTYIENGQEKTVSLRSSCLGCYYNPIEITSYVDGLCPGDKGIRCENDTFDIYEQTTEETVCAYYTEDCDNVFCMQTFSQVRFACTYQDPRWNFQTALWYAPGPCPLDAEEEEEEASQED